MRNISDDLITKTIKEMCIEANYKLSDDMENIINIANTKEESMLGKKILSQLVENMEIAKNDNIPICQDTGMVVIFAEIGQNVHIEGKSLSLAIQEGVRSGYKEGFLRKSIVEDPFIRNNTNDNTPAIIHYEIVDGDNITFTLAPKGFGSENMSKIFMLKPSDGIEGVKSAIIQTVKEAGPNACPPMVVGVGIGGDFEKCAILSKKALTRDIRKRSSHEHIKKLEEEMLIELNKLYIGPGGFGGNNTVLAINIETFPTHIAGLPVGVNICCHVNRHITKTL